MFLMQINTLFFILLMVGFGLTVFSLVGLVIYVVRYVNKSGEDKVKIFNELNQNAHRQGIVFLGDSLTEFYPADEFFYGCDVYNRGIAGDTTDGVLARLESNVLVLEPKKLFLQIGTNDLGKKKSPEDTFENIKKIIETIQSRLPETELYVISLYPVNPKATPYSKSMMLGRKNTDIRAINCWLNDYCKTHQIPYLDVASAITDENGLLKKEYTIEGLHISFLGYSAITEVLKPYVN
ncbi:MAG: GDSL-type esterase/lipase family protein [Bacilli bacterium]|nr:GDSL-type esterase/lipase family protein [Bacilli bacterium]